MTDEQFTEEISPEDIKKATAKKRVDVGEYLCIISDHEWIDMDFLTPSVTGTRYSMTVIEALNVPDEKKHDFSGAILIDDIPMVTPGEQDWRKEKRIKVATVTGILAESGGRLSKSSWPKAVGKQVIIKVTFKKEKDKESGKYKKTEFTGVDKFEGWSAADNVSEPAIDPENF
jgi:hypothetical protein